MGTAWVWLPTTSTAVLFFHYASGLQTVVVGARDLLEARKKRIHAKHSQAVGYLRRSGTIAFPIKPLSGPGERRAEIAYRGGCRGGCGFGGSLTGRRG